MDKAQAALRAQAKRSRVDAIDNARRADLVSVERIAVGRGRMTLLVRLSPACPRTTDREMARRLLAARPSLARHTCVNDRGPTFSAVIADTSVPHVLEHLIIDAQVRDPASLADINFVGTTEWLDEAAGLARVEVNFCDDIVALRALRDALSFLNGEVVPA